MNDGWFIQQRLSCVIRSLFFDNLLSDTASRLQEIDRYASTGTTNLVATAPYGYDNRDRLTSLTHTPAVSSAITYSST